MKYAPRNASLLERLMFHAQFEPNSGCWLCDLATRPDGYCNISIDHQTVLAHRASWTAHYGPIPEGFDVLHSCDTRACMNPRHLFLGDDFVNQQDRRAKGRHNNPDMRGEANPNAGLTDDEVLLIRDLCARRLMPQTAIAALFDIVQSHVSLIHRRKVWAHV